MISIFLWRRDIETGLLDALLSVTSNLLNQIIKVWSIISMIFLSLSFNKGFFGMNFWFKPLLEWQYGDEGGGAPHGRRRGPGCPGCFGGITGARPAAAAEPQPAGPISCISPA